MAVEFQIGSRTEIQISLEEVPLKLRQAVGRTSAEFIRVTVVGGVLTPHPDKAVAANGERYLYETTEDESPAYYHISVGGRVNMCQMLTPAKAGIIRSGFGAEVTRGPNVSLTYIEVR